MAVYIGLIGKDTRIEKGTVVGGSVEILCNPIKNLGGIDMPFQYHLDSSYLDLADCIPAHEQYPGFSDHMNYHAVLETAASRQRLNKPIVVLFDATDFPVDRSICGQTPNQDAFFVARVSSKDVCDKLDQFGRKFA